jgi:hypothetical protein
MLILILIIWIVLTVLTLAFINGASKHEYDKEELE